MVQKVGQFSVVLVDAEGMKCTLVGDASKNMKGGGGCGARVFEHVIERCHSR
jgi:hypothetical protein